MPITLDDITIRNDLRPGDLGAVTKFVAELFAEEYGYGIHFEAFMAESLAEFYRRYDPERDRAWYCEHEGELIGYILLMHRDNKAAQLRSFVVHKSYRGIGLGKRLMDLFMDFYRQCGYRSAYLWTTHELSAAIELYRRYDFKLTKEVTNAEGFDKPVTDQRFDLITE